MRRAAKVDGNQEPIVTALRAVGATVHSLAAVGKGCPDLLVGYRLATYLLEVKDPDQAPSKRRLRASQVDWHDYWRGGRVVVVLTAGDALRAIGAVR